MIAAGEGTDLSCALNVIFVNFPLTPDEIMQPMNRCENMARTKILTVIYTSCDDSIDEYLYELIEDKQNEINIFMGKENLNIHKHNTIEHLVSKLLKREPEGEVSEPVTHSLEGGEEVKIVEISEPKVTVTDEFIMTDTKMRVNLPPPVTERLTLEEFNRRYPKDGSLPVDPTPLTEEELKNLDRLVRVVVENEVKNFDEHFRNNKVSSTPADDFTPPDFL